MSSTTHQAPSQPAPWRSTFLSHLSSMDSPEFVLSSLHVAPANSPTPYLPRARFCIFRGMWATLPENKHNEAEKNPRVFEADCPTFTTDVRMEKVGEVFGSSAGKARKDEEVQGSGGGGPVEAVWWVKDKGVQWRVRGHAFVVGNDIEGSGEESSGVRTVKSEVGKRMRIVDASKEGEWSWKRELDGHFGNMSPTMRGTFRGPPPGQSVKEPKDDQLKLGQPVESLDDPIARQNFRVVVIKPDEVEQTDLSDPKQARRYRYTFEDSNGEWTTEELWP